MTTTQLRAHALGDSAVTIVFGSERSPQLLRRVHSAAKSLAVANIPHVDDIVPAYLALTAFYDSLHATYDEIAARLLDACERDGSSDDSVSHSNEYRIPVRYDGVDLETVAAATRLSREEVIALHSASTYTVDLLGFVPGFAYLSELDAALQLPRRPQPRPRVAAGSVAIASAQTAVYPLDTPGGWHIIGTTQTVMFDATRARPALLSPGDTVRFEPIP